MKSPARDRHCKDSRILGAYLDGELDASSLLDVEMHLSECEMCRERAEVDRATRQSLKRVVRAAPPPGGLGALRARAMTAMMAEHARTARADAALSGIDALNLIENRSKMLGWRTIVPLATAAAFALIWGAASRGPVADSGLRSDQMRASLAGDDLLAQLVYQHSSPIPPQWTDPRDVRALDQYVGVPVRPMPFERRGAALIGASLFPIHQTHAAMLQYRIGTGAGQGRFSLFIVDPRNIQISGPGLTPRAVGTAEVRVGQENGYSVAVTQNRGVGYAVVSDNEDRSAQIVALATEAAE
jgi:anti-sigma factor RsiW